MSIKDLRTEYHRRICKEIIRIRGDRESESSYPNFADGSSKSSRDIAWRMLRYLEYKDNEHRKPIKEQRVGDLFEEITKDFLESAFERLQHLRPGSWIYSTVRTSISSFNQYEHLAHLEVTVKQDKELASVLGRDYIIKPDIVIGRQPVSDKEVNRRERLIAKTDDIARLTPLRKRNYKEPRPILHASISCKWTIRSDRSQNTRTEALNLIRNRKGPLPHIVAVTAEPLPTRIASLALGTGDLDCVYHFALLELEKALNDLDNADQCDMLNMLIEGRRLRDISDLPFDLAI